jgi:hypothetical protein
MLVFLAAAEGCSLTSDQCDQEESFLGGGRGTLVEINWCLHFWGVVVTWQVFVILLCTILYNNLHKNNKKLQVKWMGVFLSLSICGLYHLRIV